VIPRLVALLGAVVVAIAAAPPYTAPLSPSPAPPASVVARAREVRAAPLPDRIGAISELLVGADYQVDAAGEGDGHDPDPPSRYDAFDCVTFVEEVLSLALAGDPSDAGRVRDALRYKDGVRSYANRNHHTELQWLPNNVASGWIVDVTGKLGPVRELRASVTVATWSNWSKRSLFALTDDQLPVGEERLDIVSPATLLAADVPAGAIVLTVREPRAGHPLWTNHVMLTVPADAPTVRHATRNGDGRVRQQSLAGYVNNAVAPYKNWPVAGFAVYLPVEQGPRLAALRPAE
jgi:hypothetical protein